MANVKQPRRKTVMAQSMWTVPPRPQQAITGKPQDSRQVRERHDATVQALEIAVRQNARMGKGTGDER